MITIRSMITTHMAPGWHSDPNSWLFLEGEGICLSSSSVKNNLKSWQPYGNHINHCLADKIAHHCKLQFSFPIAVLITVLNSAKTMLMCLAVLGVHETPPMTIGDAISTYLQQADIHSEGMCTISKQELLADPNSWVAKSQRPICKAERWSAATSKHRWVTCLTL